MSSCGGDGETSEIKKKFYTFQFKSLEECSILDFTDQSKKRVAIYQIRAYIQQNKDVESLLSKHQKLLGKKLSKILREFLLVSQNGDKSEYFESLQQTNTDLECILKSIYLVIHRDKISEAVELLKTRIESQQIDPDDFGFEIFLILVQLYIVQGNVEGAREVFHRLKKEFEEYSEDIVYQMIEAWTLLTDGGMRNLKNAFYFYDEIHSTSFEKNNPKFNFMILNQIFALNIQMKNFTDAQEILDQIDQEKYQNEINGDFLANKVSFNMINNINYDEIITKIRNLDPKHQFLQDYDEKNDRFDKIVQKYKTKDNI